MKNYLFSLIIFFGAFAVSMAQNANPQAVPDIKFEETQFNFGDIIENEPAEHNFVFKNTGTAPLLIKNSKASCGCTSPDWSREPIPPGGTGFVKARFNSMGYAGRNFSKTITVTTNIPDGGGQDKQIVLFISGNVIARPVELPQYPVKIAPPMFDFGKVKKGKMAKWAVTIVNEGDSALVLKQVRGNNAVVVKWSQAPVKKGGVIVVEFTYNTKTVDPKKINEVFTFVTNVPELNTKAISVTGLIISGEIIK